MRLLAVAVTVLAPVASLSAQVPQPRMGEPLHGLTPAELQRFQAGRADFTQVFSVAMGLGPIFNQSSCASCHNNPIGGPGSITVTRFGYTDSKGGFDPLAALGGSLLQAQAIDVACQEVVHPSANTTATRVTTSVLGLGLLEAIPDAAIVARETNPPSAAVSGRVRWVPMLEAPSAPLRAGRFGWKAQLATVLSFSGDAAQNELGFTNRLLPTENAPNGNTALLQVWDSLPDPEDQADANGLHFIDRVTDFQRFLAAPPQTPRSGMSGEAIFAAVGCADCHAPSYTTVNDPALPLPLRNQVIKPYSDFLLHDMATAGDFIADGDAGVTEIRTPPLWGVRNRDPLWHDGRVAGGTLQSRMLGPTGIIFQHQSFGSESRPSALAFAALPPADQQKVVDFLDSLGRAEFDWNGDNVRNQVDLAAFRQAQGGGPYGPDSPEAVFDIDQNGLLDAADLAAFAQVYEGDCNNNGVNDLLDVVSGARGDANGNLIPDDCEFCQPSLGYAGAGTFTLSLCGDDLTTANSWATFQLAGGAPNAPVVLAISTTANPVMFSPTEWFVPTQPPLLWIDFLVTDPLGEIRFPLFGAGQQPTWTWVFQAGVFDGANWDASNAITVTTGS